MRPFSGDTNAVHKNEVTSETRAYFSATGARLKEEVWLRVETRWVADGTALQLTIYREDEDGGREELGAPIDGTIRDNQYETQWRVELPRNRLDELRGPIQLCFEAKLDGHSLPARSQQLLVHRTRFSS